MCASLLMFEGRVKRVSSLKRTLSHTIPVMASSHTNYKSTDCMSTFSAELVQRCENAFSYHS
jgi:hypothetical protein